MSNLWSKIVYSRMGTFLKVPHNIFLCLYCLQCLDDLFYPDSSTPMFGTSSQLCVTLHTERRPEGIMSNWHNTDTCIYFHRTEATVLINRLTQLFTWVIPCQLTHFFPGPSLILMKFSGLVEPSEGPTHTKFQLIMIIIDEATALQRFLKFVKIFDFGTQNIL